MADPAFARQVDSRDVGERQPGRPRPVEHGGTSGGQDRSIAVLDFANVSGDKESAWLSAGIAETVTGDLRALGRFRVVDRGRVLGAVRRTSGSLEDVAADLDITLAVVGSYQRNGDRIR